MNEQQSRFKKILLTFLPVLIFIGILAGIEITVRLTKPNMSALDYMLSLNSAYKEQYEDPNNENIFESDPALGFKLIPNKRNVTWDQTYVSTNSRGMRYDKEVGPKEPGTVRIAAYGDSISFGWRVPMIKPDEKVLSEERKKTEKPYWMRLEDKLSTVYPDKNVEVMSFGVPGYSTYQGYESMKKSIGWSKPDIAIIQFGNNDQSMGEIKIKILNQEDKVLFNNSYWAITSKNPFVVSQSIMHLSQALLNRTSGKSSNTTSRVSQQDFVSNTLAMCKLAAENGATPLVILPIYRGPEEQGTSGHRLQQYREALREALKETDYLYIEIKELTGAGFPGNLNLFLEHIHPNSDGHSLMATRLAELMLSNNLLK